MMFFIIPDQIVHVDPELVHHPPHHLEDFEGVEKINSDSLSSVCYLETRK